MLSFFSDAPCGLENQSVHQCLSCRHDVKDCSYEREQEGRGEYHIVVPLEEVDPQPYLESNEHQGFEHADSCLEKRCLMAEHRACSCGKKHDEHYGIWDFFVIHYAEFFTGRTYDGRHTAEEH